MPQTVTCCNSGEIAEHDAKAEETPGVPDSVFMHGQLPKGDLTSLIVQSLIVEIRTQISQIA
jgi:hypothetical protein